MTQPSFAVDAPQAPKTPLDQRIIARLDAVLAQLRAADVLPWTKDELARWHVLVPQMTRQLAPADADRFQSDFDAELARLGLAQKLIPVPSPRPIMPSSRQVRGGGSGHPSLSPAAAGRSAPDAIRAGTRTL